MTTKEISTAIAEKVIASLNQGIIPWRKKWSGNGGYFNRFSGKQYSFLNQLWLELQGAPKGDLATFKQWSDKGYKIKKGAKSYEITFWKRNFYDVKDENGNPVKDENDKVKQRCVPVLKEYRVFSYTQVTDKDGNDIESVDFTGGFDLTHTDIETLLTDYYCREGIGFYEEHGDRAYYSPKKDEIHIPLKVQFDDEVGYFFTKSHESIHSTGNTKRLDRIKSTSFFGNEEYSKEELVAEIGAYSLCSMFSLKSDKAERNTIAYCQGWASHLAEAPMDIVSACGQAQKAIDYIFGNEVVTE